MRVNWSGVLGWLLVLASWLLARSVSQDLGTLLVAALALRGGLAVVESSGDDR